MPQPTEPCVPGADSRSQDIPPPVQHPTLAGAVLPGVALREDRRRNPEWRLTLVRRVRREFVEMPGMHLTLNQACRLFGLRTDICERILHELVGEEFLWVAGDGSFTRRDL